MNRLTVIVPNIYLRNLAVSACKGFCRKPFYLHTILVNFSFCKEETILLQMLYEFHLKFGLT